jgi:eukaryotic-like serine/threonine-protein kinase
MGAFKPGSQVGYFEILGTLGAGGMGEVYRALDRRLDRQVAIKVLAARYFEDPESRARLEREAKSIARINHPNICTIHDIGEQDGFVYLVFECLEGASLEVMLDRGPLPLSQLVAVALHVTEALEAAHAKGVIHRDIKPANIFVTPSGHAKVLDFGLAKLHTKLVSSSNVATMTFDSKTGTTVGTAGYMSPEQVLGRDVDARSDIFSLGVVLYRAATGVMPFPGKTTGEVADAILHKAPVPMARLAPAIPAGFENIVLKALEKDAELRYQSAGEMRADLRRLRRDSESSAEVHVHEGRPPTSNRAVVYGLGVAALAIVMLGAYFLQARRHPSRGPLSHRQLTANPSEVPVFTAAISADGKHLAYSDANGFYIRIVDTGETNPLKLPPGFCFR